jgi:uncharacterized protein YuzE
MDEVKVFFDRTGSSLIVWFGDPGNEVISEEFDEDTVLMKDKDGRVIGVERMNFKPTASGRLRWAFEEA